MDFFRRQAETRRLSRWLVLLFALAVFACVIAVDFVVVATVTVLSREALDGVPTGAGAWIQHYPDVVLISSLIVLGIIGGSCLVKSSQLSAGGSVVAESLGGTRVTADTGDPLRRRLLNVVEEMAIASGVPVPAVYVLEREAGINAFAAGHNPSNAAIAVTRGALTTLNRAELQGVIAHEFSHVLNGDMRLSTRLIGWLFGLMVFALIGRFVLRHAPRGGGGRKGGGAIAVILAAALAVMILGYIGLFFGRLIQAAVSRKRESLADASAVQFTRDPTGLRGALVKIGALGVGSRLQDTDGEEVAHLLFAAGVPRAFATHPPLEERIREIDPGFRPEEFEAMRIRMNQERALTSAQADKPVPAAAGRLEDMLKGAIVLAPAMVARLVGNPGTAHVQ
ncbi:MAG: M48 family metallopeptidase, partial [Steroidobacteraceae bacterium]